ncbi:MAG: hypothetical protein IJZ96_11440 [Lachnospiraceae bacterium]|nr:hypothetical protein [Lachnospiraceae bacterium]
MEVNYGEVRSQVIAKLQEEFSNLTVTLTKLTNTVNGIIENRYLEGETAEGYIDEFNTIVSSTFNNINLNVNAIADQLETICKKYEEMDSNNKTALSGGGEDGNR